MRFALYLLAGLLVTFATTPSNAAPSKQIGRRLIVKFKKGASQQAFLDLINGNFASTNTVKRRYNPSFFNGVAGEFTTDFLDALHEKYGSDLDYVEEDGTMHTLGSQANPPSWGQRRVSTRKLDLNAPYTYPDSAGQNVNVYVVDTGIQFDQADFGGRAKLVKSFVTGESAPDGNGHGTHCSGTIGSNTYGLAKKVNVLGVKVLNGQGSGSYSDVIAGIQYVAQQANKNAINTVMSMSLGGPKSQAVDDAVNAAVDAGVVTVVAAGNENQDACQVSPAGAAKVFTVGATDNGDNKASFSNWGNCVKIFAPGVNIISLWKGTSGSTNTISGTSMATPHVAGVAAIFLAEKKYTNVQDVYNDMISASTKGAIKGLDAASPNRLLYNVNEPMEDPNPPAPSPPSPPSPPPGDECPIPGWPPQLPCPIPPSPSPSPSPGDCPIPGWPPELPCPIGDDGGDDGLKFQDGRQH